MPDECLPSLQTQMLWKPQAPKVTSSAGLFCDHRSNREVLSRAPKWLAVSQYPYAKCFVGEPDNCLDSSVHMC